ncbi:hypothetical protein R3P38DRAFT_3202085 [Favolaschia claudopus]|uniref:Uncharacterized protein n=1 Tax=Favolaschia claudopus TaxID=2862362 RepID=A0AAW0AUL3_9AGAR
MPHCGSNSHQEHLDVSHFSRKTSSLLKLDDLVNSLLPPQFPVDILSHRNPHPLALTIFDPYPRYTPRLRPAPLFIAYVASFPYVTLPCRPFLPVAQRFDTYPTPHPLHPAVSIVYISPSATPLSCLTLLRHRSRHPFLPPPRSSAPLTYHSFHPACSTPRVTISLQAQSFVTGSLSIRLPLASPQPTPSFRRLHTRTSESSPSLLDIRPIYGHASPTSSMILSPPPTRPSKFPLSISVYPPSLTPASPPTCSYTPVLARHIHLSILTLPSSFAHVFSICTLPSSSPTPCYAMYTVVATPLPASVPPHFHLLALHSDNVLVPSLPQPVSSLSCNPNFEPFYLSYTCIVRSSHWHTGAILLHLPPYIFSLTDSAPPSLFLKNPLARQRFHAGGGAGEDRSIGSGGLQESRCRCRDLSGGRVARECGGGEDSRLHSGAWPRDGDRRGKWCCFAIV